jgi:hypothetical protein
MNTSNSLQSDSTPSSLRSGMPTQPARETRPHGDSEGVGVNGNLRSGDMHYDDTLQQQQQLQPQFGTSQYADFLQQQYHQPLQPQFGTSQYADFLQQQYHPQLQPQFGTGQYADFLQQQQHQHHQQLHPQLRTSQYADILQHQQRFGSSPYATAAFTSPQAPALHMGYPSTDVAAHAGHPDAALHLNDTPASKTVALMKAVASAGPTGILLTDLRKCLQGLFTDKQLQMQLHRAVVKNDKLKYDHLKGVYTIVPPKQSKTKEHKEAEKDLKKKAGWSAALNTYSAFMAVSREVVMAACPANSNIRAKNKDVMVEHGRLWQHLKKDAANGENSKAIMKLLEEIAKNDSEKQTAAKDYFKQNPDSFTDNPAYMNSDDRKAAAIEEAGWNTCTLKYVGAWSVGHVVIEPN